MPYPVITPQFFAELTNPEDSRNAGIQYQVLTTPAAVEYVFPLNQERVVRRLMEQKDSQAYRMVSLKPELEEEYLQKGKKIVEDRPILKHYWQIKTLTMNLLQDRRYTMDVRMWLLNYAYKNIQFRIDNVDPENKLNEEGKRAVVDRAIEAFIQQMLHSENHDDVIEYFKEIRPNPPYALVDGLAILKQMGDSEDIRKLRTVAFKHAGVPKDSESFEYDEALCAKIKNQFNKEFSWIPAQANTEPDPQEDSDKIDRRHYLEQIMVNYVWSYCFPYADLNYDLWGNFIFLNTLYNAIKVTLSCYLYNSKTIDEDFVFAMTAFDNGLRGMKVNISRVIVEDVKRRGFDNNGDMAILSIS